MQSASVSVFLRDHIHWNKRVFLVGSRDTHNTAVWWREDRSDGRCDCTSACAGMWALRQAFFSRSAFMSD